MEEDIRAWIAAAAIVPALLAATSGLSQFGRDRRREGRIKRDLELLALMPSDSIAAKSFLRSIEIAVAERTAERLVPYPLSGVILPVLFISYGALAVAVAFAADTLDKALLLIGVGMFCLVAGALVAAIERVRVMKYRTRQRRAIMLGRASAQTRIDLGAQALRVMIGENRVVPATRRKRPRNRGQAVRSAAAPPHRDLA